MHICLRLGMPIVVTRSRYICTAITLLQLEVFLQCMRAKNCCRYACWHHPRKRRPLRLACASRPTAIATASANPPNVAASHADCSVSRRTKSQSSMLESCVSSFGSCVNLHRMPCKKSCTTHVGCVEILAIDNVPSRYTAEIQL